MEKDAQVILLVAGSGYARESIRAILAAIDGATILNTANGESTLQAVREHQPDIVLLDMNYSDDGQLELMKQVRQVYPQAKCLVITPDKGGIMVDFTNKVLSAGADGVLSRNMSAQEFIRAIRGLAAPEGETNPGEGSSPGAGEQTERESEWGSGDDQRDTPTQPVDGDAIPENTKGDT